MGSCEEVAFLHITRPETEGSRGLYPERDAEAILLFQRVRMHGVMDLQWSVVSGVVPHGGRRGLRTIGELKISFRLVLSLNLIVALSNLSLNLILFRTICRGK